MDYQKFNKIKNKRAEKVHSTEFKIWIAERRHLKLSKIHSKSAIEVHKAKTRLDNKSWAKFQNFTERNPGILEIINKRYISECGMPIEKSEQPIGERIRWLLDHSKLLKQDFKSFEQSLQLRMSKLQLQIEISEISVTIRFLLSVISDALIEEEVTRPGQEPAINCEIKPYKVYENLLNIFNIAHDSPLKFDSNQFLNIALSEQNLLQIQEKFHDIHHSLLGIENSKIKLHIEHIFKHVSKLGHEKKELQRKLKKLKSKKSETPQIII